MSSPSLNPGRCSSAPTRRCPDTVRAEPRRHQAQLPGRGAGACPQRTGKVKQGQPPRLLLPSSLAQFGNTAIHSCVFENRI